MGPTKPKRKRRKRDYIAPGFAVVAIVIVVLSRWMHTKEPLPRVQTEQERKAALSQTVKIGMKMDDALKELATLGYECVRTRPPEFNPGLSPIYCHKTEPVRDDVPPVHWQIMMRNDATDHTTNLSVQRDWKPPAEAQK